MRTEDIKDLENKFDFKILFFSLLKRSISQVNIILKNERALGQFLLQGYSYLCIKRKCCLC